MTTPEEIAAEAAEERQRARQDLHAIWKWCSGGHHKKQLQKEYRARWAKTKPNAERDRGFAQAAERLGDQAFILMQAIDGGQELIHSYGQIVARAAQLGFWTWEDKLSAGVQSGGSAGRDRVPDHEKEAWRLLAIDIWKSEPKAKLSDVAERVLSACVPRWLETKSAPWKASTLKSVIGCLSPRSPKKEKDQ